MFAPFFLIGPGVNEVTILISQNHDPINMKKTTIDKVISELKLFSSLNVFARNFLLVTIRLLILQLCTSWSTWSLHVISGAP